MRWFFLVLLSSCALTSKSKPLEVRYFSPTVASPASSPELAGPAPSTPPLRLRLGRVEAASYLRARIAYRPTGHELGYYETLRWTEDPDAFVRRALSRAFFEERGIEEVASGAGPTLELELSAFEEVRAPEHVVRIEVTWKLRDGRAVIAQRTVSVTRPVAGRLDPVDGEALARAMGGALAEVVEQIVGAVLVELARVV